MHKIRDENVFIDDLTQTSEPGRAEATFTARLVVHDEHPFFFERKRGHVTGLYLVEAGRQMGIAVSHMYYDVPLGNEFIMGDLTVKFHAFAGLERPIWITGTMSDISFRKGQLSGARFSGSMSQEDRLLIEIGGAISILDRQVVHRLERATASKGRSVI